MTGAILAQAWRAISRDWGATLRIIALPWLVAVGMELWISSQLERLVTSGSTHESLSVIATTFLGSLVGFLCLLWIAVSWHRHVLRGEQAHRFLPRWHGYRLLAYFGWSILIAILMGLVFSALNWGIHTLGLTGAIGAILNFFGLAVIGILALRLSLVLPSAALGGRMTLGKSWQRTGEIAGSVTALALLFVVLKGALSQVFYLLPAGAISSGLWMSLDGVVSLLFVSVLTSLYGYLEEGRSLDE